MHAGGLLAASQTTASWVSELRKDGCRHWLTATAAPSTSIFKPMQVEHPVDIGTVPGDRVDESLWWQHERFHRKVMQDPARLLPLFQTGRDAIEASWLENPPDTVGAITEHRRLLDKWGHLIDVEKVRDTRPLYIRQYWKKRNRIAGIE
jgi:hypothetical protein